MSFRLLASVSVLAVAITPAAAQSSAPRLGANAPTLGYKEVPDWPTPATNAAGTPAAWNFIQVSGVAVDARGHVLALHRGAHPLLEFESNGTFVQTWDGVKFSEGKVAAIAPRDRTPGRSAYSAVYGPAGCDSCGAHSVRVDPQHNIWVVDATGQAIYKMDPRGKVILQLGQKGIAGTGHNSFNLPTDVGFAPNGDFYVTDGYASARVVKFSHDGKYLLEWGGRGKMRGSSSCRTMSSSTLQAKFTSPIARTGVSRSSTLMGSF